MTERAGEVATCYCSRDIVSDGEQWTHTDDGVLRCYPDEPRDAEMVAEPDPYQPADCEDVCMTECQGACGVL